MKNLLITLVLLCWGVMTSWAQTDYLQWEAGYMKPTNSQLAKFKKGLAAHAKKYHASDPYKMWAWEVVAGPHSGEYFVALGPSTFTQLDNRPSGEDHEADWNDNVLAYTASAGENAYWRLDTTLNYRPAGSDNFGKARFRWVTLLPGQGDRYTDLLEKLHATVKVKNYTSTWAVYRRYGASTGPHVCVEMSFSNWAYLDAPIQFIKDYEEVHGENSYKDFLEELDLCIDRSKTFDELLVLAPELSSPQN